MGLLLGSFWAELGLVFGTLLLLFYFWLQDRYKYFERLGIPYVKPTFIIGNNYRAMFGLEQINDAYNRFYRELEGHKMGGIFQVFTPVLIVRDPSLVTQVLIKDFSSFHGHGFLVDEKTNPLEGHLFAVEGEKWRTLRKKLSPTFTSGKLKWMFDQMAVCGDSLIDVVREGSKGGQEVEVKDVLARFTTDVIASCAFGYEPIAVKDPDCEFRQLSKKIFNPSLMQTIMFAFRFAFPKLFYRLKIRTIPKDVEDFFYNLVSQTFEHRLKTGEVRNDFVQLLLQLREKGKIEYDPKDKDEVEEYVAGPLDDNQGEAQALELTNDVLTAQAFVFFGGGFETSATSISFMLYFLSKNEDWQDKAREEVKRVKAAHGGKISYQALKEMRVLDACVKETMRLMPPMDIVFRQCYKDTFLDGKKIEKGAKIIITSTAIQTDPAYFPDPLEFKPDRFLPGGQDIVPGSYLPFGDGPRICIARRFALLEAQLAVALILDNFRMKTGPSLKEPLVFHPRNFIKTPIGGLWMKFERLDEVQAA